MSNSSDQRAQYFDAKFERNADPWRYAQSWYEARKRVLLLAALPRARYRNAFEPGCANGMLSAELALRCDQLLCADFAPHAVSAARERLAAFAHVSVQTLAMPHDWPPGRFDLLVLSEFVYYLDARDCAQLATRAIAALDHDGTLALCHWRHGGESWMLDAASVHEAFSAAASSASLLRAAQIADADFLIDIWSRDPQTVAQRERT
jgi:SAM-dependent methyltransferase